MAEEREIQFLGKIYKCPNCGAHLDSFCAFCPACGFEIRENNTTNSINDFIKELNKKSEIDEKTSFIENYHIQNTKEDILEFLILANKQIVNYDKNGDGELQEDELKLAKAYKVLADDCYERAKALGISDQRIEEVYGRITAVDNFLTKTVAAEKMNTSIKEIRKSFQKSQVLEIDIALIVILIIIFALAKIFGSPIAMVLSILAILLCLSSVLAGFRIVRLFRSSGSILFLILSLFMTAGSVYFMCRINYKEKITELKYGKYIEWDNLGVLSKYVPKFDPINGVLYSDTSDLLQFGFEYESDKDYGSWIDKIKKKGFTIESEDHGRSYKAFNQGGYFAKIVQGDKYIETTIVPPFAWNSLFLSNCIPTGYFYSGITHINTDEAFNVTLKYSEDSYINEYIDSCVEFGYNKNVIQSKNSFIGYNKDGMRLSVFCDADEVTIDFQKSFDWSELLLSEVFPQIYESGGKVLINEENRNTVSFDKVSSTRFEAYTKQCQESGYRYNIFSNTAFFRATNESNLIVARNSNCLEASVICSTFEWTTPSMTSVLPEMDGIGGTVYGFLTKDEHKSFEATVYGLTKTEIEDYIMKCKEKGFTTDVVSNDKQFKATWERNFFQGGDVFLTINYDSFDHIIIKVEK